MKVYQLRTNSDRHQSFDTGFLYEHRYRAPPGGDLSRMYIRESRLLPTDFYNIRMGYLITSSRAAEALREHLESAGRVLRFTYQGHEFTYTDVDRCLDVLDDDRSEFRVGERSGVRLGIQRYAFRAERFPSGTSLFTLHYEFGMWLYVLEGQRDFAREFREIVESERLTGLSFREIWNNDQEPEYCGTPWGIRDYLMSPEDVQLRKELGVKDEHDPGD